MCEFIGHLIIASINTKKGEIKLTNYFKIDIDKYRDPFVPKEFIRYTCGHYDFDEFLLSGAEIFLMFKLALKKYFDKTFSDFNGILDFGCGCGKIMRFYKQSCTKLYGYDVNASMIDFLKKNCPVPNVIIMDYIRH